MLKPNRYLIWRSKFTIGKPDQAVLILVLCCMLLFFSSCANPLSVFDAPPVDHPTPTLPKASITQSPSGIRTDNSIESPLKVQLAKVQQIMSEMTLDQKFSPLLVVEYLGNSYSGTELQYMIAKQYVGGFLIRKAIIILICLITISVTLRVFHNNL